MGHLRGGPLDLRGWTYGATPCFGLRGSSAHFAISTRDPPSGSPCLIRRVDELDFPAGNLGWSAPSSPERSRLRLSMQWPPSATARRPSSDRPRQRQLMIGAVDPAAGSPDPLRARSHGEWPAPHRRLVCRWAIRISPRLRLRGLSRTVTGRLKSGHSGAPQNRSGRVG